MNGSTEKECLGESMGLGETTKPCERAGDTDRFRFCGRRWGVRGDDEGLCAWDVWDVAPAVGIGVTFAVNGGRRVAGVCTSTAVGTAYLWAGGETERWREDMRRCIAMRDARSPLPSSRSTAGAGWLPVGRGSSDCWTGAEAGGRRREEDIYPALMRNRAQLIPEADAALMIDYREFGHRDRTWRVVLY